MLTVVSDTRIQLNWTDVATDEDAYRVERMEGAGMFVQVATLPAGTTTWLNTGLTPNTTYTFRVRARRGLDHSDYSNEETVATLP